MEILYSLFNIISSLVTEVLYDKSLVNSLFSFDLNKKYVVFNHAKNKMKSLQENNVKKDIQKMGTLNLKEKIQELENNNNNIEIYAQENSGKRKIISKTNVLKTKKQIIMRKKPQYSGTTKFSKTSNILLKEQISPKENAPSNDNKIFLEKNKIISDNIHNINNNNLRTNTDNVNISEKDLTNIYINNWLICCFWCSSRKKNVNKILFDEGSKIITQRLDILVMFNHFYVIEIMQKKLGIEARGMNMSDNCKEILQIYNTSNNNYKTINNL